MNARLAVLVSVLAIAVPGLAWPADAVKGKVIAERWCASCHIVSPAQKKGSADAPTFAQISTTRTLAQITGALTAGHTRMPDMALSRDDLDNLIVYMQTLAPAREPFKRNPEKDTPPKTHRG